MWLRVLTEWQTHKVAGFLEAGQEVPQDSSRLYLRVTSVMCHSSLRTQPNLRR